MAVNYEEKLQKAKQAAARAQARLAKLQNVSRAQDTAHKVLVGAVIIAAAKEAGAVSVRKFLVGRLEAVSKPHDRERLAPLIAELKAMGLGGDQAAA